MPDNATPATEPTVDLHPTPNAVQAAESNALFTVTGPRVHNRHHPHRVIKFRDGSLILAAQCVVITAHPEAPNGDYNAGEVTFGDVIVVDGRRYVVTPRPLADPALMPAPATAAEREAARKRKADQRVTRLEGQAERAASKAQSAQAKADWIADGYPLGQPVQPPGHHSRGKHLRDLAKVNRYDDRAREGRAEARGLAQRAASVAAIEAAKDDPRAIMRRIRTMEADLRRWERVVASKQTSAEYAARAAREIAELREDIRHQRAKLAELAESGEFVTWGREHFQPGDMVKVCGRWLPVRRVNTKSVSVPGGYGMAGNDASWSDTVRWDDIHGRRRDGEQLDTPNGRPWPVATAAKVARWRELLASAGVTSSRPEDKESRRRVAAARRIVHGLRLSAADAEVQAYLDDVTDEATRRALAVACVGIYDRLANGEKSIDVAASTEPFPGLEPTWTLPDTEPEKLRAGPLRHDDGRQIRPGDVIRGFYDDGMGHPFRNSFCGPVEHVSDVINRREAGEFVTVTLTTGEERTFPTHIWFSAHRGPALPEPAPIEDTTEIPAGPSMFDSLAELVAAHGGG